MTRATRIPTLVAMASMMAALAGSNPVRAEIYRWTDEHGKVHYADRKPAAEGAGPVESWEGDAKVSFIGSEAVANRSAAAVRLFTTRWCSFCKRAKAYLQKRGTPFEELDVEASPAAKAEFKRLGGRGVPVILVGRERMDGFDDAALEAMLVDAGW